MCCAVSKYFSLIYCYLLILIFFFITFCYCLLFFIYWYLLVIIFFKLSFFDFCWYTSVYCNYVTSYLLISISFYLFILIYQSIDFLFDILWIVNILVSIFVLFTCIISLAYFLPCLFLAYWLWFILLVYWLLLFPKFLCRFWFICFLKMFRN